MAMHVIDLTSSSPSPEELPDHVEPLEDAQKSNWKQPQEAVEDNINHDLKTSSTIRIEESLLISDDFDITIDLDELVKHLATGHKRRQLSPPANEIDRPSKKISLDPSASNDGPGIRHTSRARGNIATEDPIFSSSPQLSVPVSARSSLHSSSRQATAKISASTSLEPWDLNSDPFATSPNLPPPSRPPLKSTFDELSDPFQSSPHQMPPPSKQPSPKRPVVTIIDELSDPFASSPPIRNSPRRPNNNERPSNPRNSTNIGRSSVRPASPKRSKEWDPISSSMPEQRSFSSSPPSRGQIRHSKHQPQIIDIVESDSDDKDDSEDELPDISNFDVSRPLLRARSPLRRSQSDVISSRSRTNRTSAKPAAKKSAEEKAREKEGKAAAREAEKEKQRVEKQQAKEAKTREKECAAALAEANKVKTDKKVSTPEMIVDIPNSLGSTHRVQLEEFLVNLNVQHDRYDSPVENVVKWRRKVRSIFNDDLGLWEPTYLRIEDEKYALVVMAAEKFVELVLKEEVEDHITKMQLHYRNHNIMYLIEGLTPWMRKNRNIRNRQFTSGVRSREPSASQAQPPRRRNNAASTPEYIPEEIIEDALLQLQVMHDVLIHHTMIALETAQWIGIFTQHVSTVPYRKQKELATTSAGFCMESGQVKTGEDASDTYIKMLQEIVRVTAPIAYGIASEFESVGKLVAGLEVRGPGRLEDLKKCANRDGAFTDRTIGPAMSRRMHKVFTGQDEKSTDV